ncbi:MULTISPECIES: thiol-disulfide oxidoreductase DCC family protein [Pseudomonas]|uniref:Thiol-disulfide oxidoreductase n=1 Tax=Pseudomonas oryzihabitans TaxID=47885 RepID=A0A178LIF8_9PSED|nr:MULTISPECIES: DUF393 domain-containing protein [Pseudomonas]MDC7831144.1 DUF393 domain-containing protein [Pseudomonas benzopyrenica]MXS17408.1 DUF393 domain-containing protein [Pseudomonas oryzihabitans]OAN30378.1 thiol-disulfide oxidoreductase [Pseudomonas oryzihabitans]SEP43158.1 Predicted thiol-disulfide oxidoreductase YuxK, DCC family [Pseudomonas sp. Snoq117.2]
MHAPRLPLTLFHDGACPLCAREIAWLRRHADPSQLHLVDLAAPDYEAQAPADAPPRQAMLDLLHARDADGYWFKGLDATYWSWRTAGLGHWARPLAWRPLRPLLEMGYRLFLKLRPGLTWLPHPEGSRRCQDDVCTLEEPRDRSRKG